MGGKHHPAVYCGCGNRITDYIHEIETSQGTVEITPAQAKELGLDKCLQCRCADAVRQFNQVRDRLSL